MKSWIEILLKIFTPFRLAIIVGLGIFIWSLIFGDQGIIQLNKLIYMKKQLTDQRENLKEDMGRLTHEKELLNNPKYLEWVIRNELGFIKPGEIIYQERERNAP